MSQGNATTNMTCNNLNRSLQKSLRDVLNEVSLDSSGLMGAPAAPASCFSAASRTTNAPRQSFLDSLQSFCGSGLPGISGLDPSSGFHRASSSANKASAVNPYAALAFTNANSIGMMRTTNGASAATEYRRPSEALGMSTEELFLAAATEKRMLDQTQLLAAHQQSLAEKTFESRRRYNESLLALMKSKHNPSVGPLGGNGLVQQGLMQQFNQKPRLGSTAVAPLQQGNNSKVAIQVLGTSLRKKDSPYLDVSALQDPDVSDKRTRGGVTEPFPEKLHRMLEEVQKQGKDDIISFFSHGRAFAVHDPDRFTSEVMPNYFNQSRLSSFQRQLNLYGFTRITSGPDAGGYYHELFLKGRPSLAVHMRRVGLPKGEDRRKMRTKNQKVEPNFYSMGPVADARPHIPGIIM